MPKFLDEFVSFFSIVRFPLDTLLIQGREGVDYPECCCVSSFSLKVFSVHFTESVSRFVINAWMFAFSQ